MPSIVRHPSKVDKSAFLAIIHVLVFFLLVAVAVLTFIFRRIRRRQIQQRIPCLTGIRTITSPAPFSPDYDRQFTQRPMPLPQHGSGAQSIRPKISSPSQHSMPRIPSRPHFPVIRVLSPTFPIQKSATTPIISGPSPGVVVNEPNPSARNTWSTESTPLPITSDTTQISDDDIHTLGVRGVVNQGFAEMLARRKKYGSKFTALFGSEEGSTVASGDVGDGNSMSMMRRSSRKTQRGSIPMSISEPTQEAIEESELKPAEVSTPKATKESRPTISDRPTREAVGHKKSASNLINIPSTNEELERGRVREMTRAWERLHGRTIMEGDDEEEAPLTPIAKPAPLVVRKVPTFPGPEAGS